MKSRERVAAKGSWLLLTILLTLPLAGCTQTAVAVIRPPATASTTRAAAPNVGALRIHGVLIDQLVTGAGLGGALISLEGREIGSMTAGDGSFVLDSVLPGAHRLLARHPMLDSMGIDTIGIAFVVGDSANVGELSLPTATEFIASRCARPVRLGTGLVSGVVRGAADDEPLADVEVAAAWRGQDTSYAGAGLRERARVRTTQQGRFLLCNVPRFTPVELWARQHGSSSPRIRVQLGAAQVAAYDMSLELSLEPASRRAPTAVSAGTVDTSGRRAPRADGGTIVGRIITPAGEGLPNVTVLLDRSGMQSSAVSDTGGRFAFSDVPPGVRQLELRAIGFRASTLGVNVRPLQRVARTITLERNAALLGAVVVRGTRTATWDSVGFEERRRRGNGYFFTVEQLRDAVDLASTLRMVPGISGRSSQRGQRLTAGRGAGCQPAFVVNGVRFAAGGGIGPEAMMRPQDIRAMEVYTSRLSTPPEHQRFADCAVIVIWLRDPQRERESDMQRRMQPDPVVLSRQSVNRSSSVSRR